MKKILLLITFLLPVVAFGQTTTEYTLPTGDKGFYIIKSSWADSLANYYSSSIDLGTFLDVDYDKYPVSVAYEGTSDDSVVVMLVIQGRNVLGTSSAWADVDTIVAKLSDDTGATTWTTCDMNDARPHQIRIKMDGLTNNRSTAKVEVWVELIRGK